MNPVQVHTLADDLATRVFAASFVDVWKPGDVVFLEGPLGVGKTTFVRGYLEALGHVGPVRSPTFTIMQLYATVPPVVHADLYRLKDWRGIGLEDLLDDHVVLIEWPDRAVGLVSATSVWRLKFMFKDEGRTVAVVPPRA